MKKIIWILAILGVLQTQAQVKMGLRLGTNLSKFSTGEVFTARLNANGTPVVGFNGQVVKDNLRESLDSRTGFVGGVWLRFGNELYLQPEVLVSTKGGTFDVIKDGKTTPVDFRVTNVDIPVLVGMKAKFLRLNAGPLVSLRVGDDESLSAALKNYTTGSLNDALAKATYGYMLGGGIDIGGLSIDIRKEGAFSDIATIDLTSSAGTAKFNQKATSWQISLAFKIL